MSQRVRPPAPPLLEHHPPSHPAGRPPTVSLVQLAAVFGCLAFALVAPALMVRPGASWAPGWRLAAASGLTVLGVLGAVAVCAVAYLRTRNFSWLIVACVPGGTLLIGAVVFAATKAV